MYVQESKEFFYENMRRPLKVESLGPANIEGPEPTTSHLTDDLALTGTKSTKE
jgi:hypothetical protein